MIPFALFIFRGYITIFYFQIGLSIAIIIFLVFIGVFAYALKYPLRTKYFLVKITKKIQKITKKETPQHFIERISMEVDNFHNSMIFFLTKGKKTFLYAGIVTALFWITGWTIPILLLLGLGLCPTDRHEAECRMPNSDAVICQISREEDLSIKGGDGFFADSPHRPIDAGHYGARVGGDVAAKSSSWHVECATKQDYDALERQRESAHQHVVRQLMDSGWHPLSADKAGPYDVLQQGIPVRRG